MTTHDFIAQSALRDIRHFAELAITPEPRPADAPDSYLGMSEAEIRHYSLGKAIRVLTENRGSWAGYRGIERESSDKIASVLGPTRSATSFYVPYEIQTRALVSSSTAGGGYLVETSNLGIIELLRRRVLASRLGAQRLTGLKADISQPRQASSTTAGPLATQTTQVTESDISFGQMSLSPHPYAAFTQVSRQLILQSSPEAVATVISNDLTKVGAVAEDDATFNGSGTGGQPTGIFATTGIQTISGASFSTTTALTMEDMLLGSNINGIALAFVAHPDTAKLLAGRQKFSGVSDVIWSGNLRDGTVGGLPAATSVTIPAGTLALIDFSEIVIGEWGTLEIEVDPFTSFVSGVVGIRAMWSFDVGVSHPLAVCLATGVT